MLKTIFLSAVAVLAIALTTAPSASAEELGFGPGHGGHEVHQGHGHPHGGHFRHNHPNHPHGGHRHFRR